MRPVRSFIPWPYPALFYGMLAALQPDDGLDVSLLLVREGLKAAAVDDNHPTS